MKILIINLALILTFTASLIAQSKSVADSKARLIDTQVFFDEKAGIKDFIEVDEKLEQEFKSQEAEIKVLFEKHREISNQLEQISKHPGHPAIPEKILTEKIQELALANCILKEKTEFVRIIFEQRRAKLLEEVNKKILIVLKQFAKENDYSAILDISEVNLTCNSGFCVCFNSDLDITKEFIQFYNSRTEKK